MGSQSAERPTKLKLVLVEWIDAESDDRWLDLSDLENEPLPIIKTVGFIVRETKDVLTLAMNYDEKNEKISCLMSIPKGGMIKRVTQLKAAI